MTDWISDIIRAGGYAGIALLMLLENIFPPIPSEVVMPLAGYLASKDDLSLIGVVIAGTAGSVLGALAFYYLGRKLGAERLKEWCDRHGRWLAISARDVEKTQRWFDRYGIWTVLLLRLVPGLRSLISIPAGISRMPLLPFVLFTTIGSALWSALLAWAGLVLGQHYESAENYIGPVSTGVIALLAGWYLWRLIRPTRD